MIICHYLYRIQAGIFFGGVVLKIRVNLTRSFYKGAFLLFVGLLSIQVHADGIASTNSYVEINSSATDFRA